jgi:hypothetical protein
VRELIEVAGPGHVPSSGWTDVRSASQPKPPPSQHRAPSRATSQLRHDAAGHDDDALRPRTTTHTSTAAANDGTESP